MVGWRPFGVGTHPQKILDPSLVLKTIVDFAFTLAKVMTVHIGPILTE